MKYLVARNSRSVDSSKRTYYTRRHGLESLVKEISCYRRGLGVDNKRSGVRLDLLVDLM